MATRKRQLSTEKLVTMAILTALVIVLQFLSMALRFGTFSITLTLLPIVVGAALYGILAGGWLGLVFGIIVLATGDAALFMGINPAGTIITVLVKGTAAGVLSGLVHKLVAKFNHFVSVIAAAFVAPIVNTGVFVLGCYIFMYDGLTVMAGDKNIFPLILFGFIGINFIIEFATNVIFSPAAVKIIELTRKKK